ncbi:hypothetical protein [Hyphobacterium indicum]|uniref:hypothetical protein n=1 Tax=Hyphobacterium indicum TaxID=2162714 RepID=UPI000F637FAA|nr:hypothetical protein [Hyphobacterium indicum]
MILLAVALFAALSYAVTQAGRSGGKDISDEDARLAASQILQHFTLLEQTTERMRLMNNVPANMVDLRDGASAPNSLCITVDCQLFHPDGGGATAKNFFEYAHPDIVEPQKGQLAAELINVPEVGTSSNDIALRYIVMQDKVCEALNDKLNLPGIITHSDSGGETYHPWSGNVLSFIDSSTVRTYGDDAGEEVLVGQRTFCVRRGSQPWIYHVLIPR